MNEQSGEKEMTILEKRMEMFKFVQENNVIIKNNEIKMSYEAEADNISCGNIVARYDKEARKIRYYLEVGYDAGYYGAQIGLIELDFDQIKNFKKNVEMLASDDFDESKNWR